MPLFKGKRRDDFHAYESLNHANDSKSNINYTKDNKSISRNGTNSPVQKDGLVNKPKLVFHCQQAQGSPTGIISGFTNVRELYKKIGECYDIAPEEVLFCTLNTHKVDMARLLGGQIGLDDFIFAHRKGRPKEIEITKTDDALGLTITDNGAGYAFIKRIKEGSIIENIECIQVGDHIERIDKSSMVGKRHFEVAKTLKQIHKGTTFTLRVIEPLKAGFANIGPRSDTRSSMKKNFGSGKQTLRFKANGKAEVQEEHDDVAKVAIEKINILLENYMGINDNDLASQIWDIAEPTQNTVDFAEAIDTSDLDVFAFEDHFIFEIWGAITDARAGRISKK